MREEAVILCRDIKVCTGCGQHIVTSCWVTTLLQHAVLSKVKLNFKKWQ